MRRGIHIGCSFFLSRECFRNRDISWLRNGFVLEKGENRDVSLCGRGDHSLESVSQCLEEEFAAELVGNMVSLNAGVNAFGEEVVGEAAHVKGVGL